MNLIYVAQIIVAVLVVVIILAQVRGGGLSGVFGGQGESEFKTRRGIERTLFRFTIVLVVIFIGLCIATVTL
jgi:preprotein translocase subunit SecG